MEPSANTYCTPQNQSQIRLPLSVASHRHCLTGTTHRWLSNRFGHTPHTLTSPHTCLSCPWSEVVGSTVMLSACCPSSYPNKHNALMHNIYVQVCVCTLFTERCDIIPVVVDCAVGTKLDNCQLNLCMLHVCLFLSHKVQDSLVLPCHLQGDTCMEAQIKSLSSMYVTVMSPPHSARAGLHTEDRAYIWGTTQSLTVTGSLQYIWTTAQWEDGLWNDDGIPITCVSRCSHFRRSGNS